MLAFFNSIVGQKFHRDWRVFYFIGPPTHPRCLGLGAKKSWAAAAAGGGRRCRAGCSLSCGCEAESKVGGVGVSPGRRRLFRLSAVEEVPDEDGVVVRAETRNNSSAPDPIFESIHLYTHC